MFGKFKKKSDEPLETPSQQSNDLFTLLEEDRNNQKITNPESMNKEINSKSTTKIENCRGRRR